MCVASLNDRTVSSELNPYRNTTDQSPTPDKTEGTSNTVSKKLDSKINWKKIVLIALAILAVIAVLGGIGAAIWAGVKFGDTPMYPGPYDSYSYM